jgi:hypothetical protein
MLPPVAAHNEAVQKNRQAKDKSIKWTMRVRAGEIDFVMSTSASKT